MISTRELEYLRAANRKCGLSYRSSCKRNSGLVLAKNLREKGLVYLYDKGEKCKQGRFIWRTTYTGKSLLEKE